VRNELSRPALDDVLLATDLHAGNVLRAQRQPWLVIDPKPFVGDRVCCQRAKKDRFLYAVENNVSGLREQ
jgi:streptomycin 6-kinase